MKKLLLILILLFPISAKAAEHSAVCQVLAEHHPEKNVIHKEGADVNATATAFQVPDVIKVPLTVDLAKRVASLIGKNVQLEAPMGMLGIHQDGKITYNGEDWTTPVMTLCGRSHVVKETIEVETKKTIEPQAVAQKSILNRTKILNKAPLINQIPAGDRAGSVSVSEYRQAPVEVIKSQAIQEVAPQKKEVKAVERTLIEVNPTEAIPPQDINTAIVRETRMKEPEVISGGEYREIFYNE